MTTWTRDSRDSPERVDALVFGLTDVIEASAAGAFLESLKDARERPVETAHLPGGVRFPGFELSSPGLPSEHIPVLANGAESIKRVTNAPYARSAEYHLGR